MREKSLLVPVNELLGQFDAFVNELRARIAAGGASVIEMAHDDDLGVWEVTVRARCADGSLSDLVWRVGKVLATDKSD